MKSPECNPVKESTPSMSRFLSVVTPTKHSASMHNNIGRRLLLLLRGRARVGGGVADQHVANHCTILLSHVALSLARIPLHSAPGPTNEGRSESAPTRLGILGDKVGEFGLYSVVLPNNAG